MKRGHGMPFRKDSTWFYRYLSPPIREVLDAGPAAEKMLRAPRHAEVCVLFTDIRGFTEMSRTIGVEVLTETVNFHIAEQAQSVEQFGGYVDNFTGDGLMALFEGWQKEERACQCALAIMDGAGQAPPTPSKARPVPLGVGLHAGHVVLASLGCETWRTYTAIGRTVNVAARLCDHAVRPAIITSEVVREQVPEACSMAFDTLWGDAPRGVDQSLGLYQLRHS